MITIEQYWMGRDKRYQQDMTQEIRDNATLLVSRVNKLLEVMGKGTSVNSGWRPATVNRQVGGAKRSNHIIGKAIDLNDDDGSIDEWCMNNLKELEKVGLWLEHPSKTPRWTHLQSVSPRSGKRVFLP
jgi:uncharacterized protein YcbK (DUF882 family)